MDRESEQDPLNSHGFAEDASNQTEQNQGRVCKSTSQNQMVLVFSSSGWPHPPPKTAEGAAHGHGARPAGLPCKVRFLMVSPKLEFCPAEDGAGTDVDRFSALMK